MLNTAGSSVFHDFLKLTYVHLRRNLDLEHFFFTANPAGQGEGLRAVPGVNGGDMESDAK